MFHWFWCTLIILSLCYDFQSVCLHNNLFLTCFSIFHMALNVWVDLYLKSGFPIKFTNSKLVRRPQKIINQYIKRQWFYCGACFLFRCYPHWMVAKFRKAIAATIFLVVWRAFIITFAVIIVTQATIQRQATIAMEKRITWRPRKNTADNVAKK